MISLPDLLIYAAHLAFWLLFAAGHVYARGQFAAPAPSPAATDAPPMSAPYSRLLVGMHMIAFAILYSGIGLALFHSGVPRLIPFQRVLGCIVILAGGALMCWARVWFASWRYRAEITADHQLATGGPFRFIRHPLYAGLNLLALGTAIWIPTLIEWIALALMLLVSDLRARAEESLLDRAFGQSYRDYRQRTRRFIPGVY
ncbi:MAG: isoprenylcysteine carboxylmethyltransferase family protein [Planctomycetia bacterium]|jgi:protein-S-isoprenylcysteine O-methyltransferase Ste14|nr:isoprenylcysteine carboxylmethyltransferase family protein [Planctomycetia bacterium]